jgi:hypothetical protein
VDCYPRAGVVSRGGTAVDVAVSARGWVFAAFGADRSVIPAERSL